jgi:hypothetical protein
VRGSLQWIKCCLQVLKGGDKRRREGSVHTSVRHFTSRQICEVYFLVGMILRFLGAVFEERKVQKSDLTFLCSGLWFC